MQTRGCSFVVSPMLQKTTCQKLSEETSCNAQAKFSIAFFQPPLLTSDDLETSFLSTQLLAYNMRFN